MKYGFFKTIFYIPLYNALIYLISVMPNKSAGLAVVLLTVIIRIILYPLSKKSIKTQLQMRTIEPEVQKLKEKYKDRQEQAKKLMELYKEKEINPFAGILLILIQFPILIALYQVFQSGLPTVNAEYLYSFIQNPATVSMTFLGIDLTQRSIILAIIAVITQFIQLQIALPKAAKRQPGQASSLQTDLAYSMNVQMKYIFPLIMFPIAYFSAVLGVYLSVSNILMILQELFVKKRMEKEYAAKNTPSVPV